MGAFEQLFGLVMGEFEQKFSKNSNAQGFAWGGGMLKLRFDWYIIFYLQGDGLIAEGERGVGSISCAAF